MVDEAFIGFVLLKTWGKRQGWAGCGDNQLGRFVENKMVGGRTIVSQIGESASYIFIHLHALCHLFIFQL